MVIEMPRSGGKKPIFPRLYNRHLDEMRALLQILDPGAAMQDEGVLSAPMDIYETEREIVLEIDMPGLEVSAITLLIRGVMLQIEVEKMSEALPEEGRYICIERHFGRFRRTVRLPDNVDTCGLKAEYGRGVLRIICPKGQDRRIPIKELSCEPV